MELNIYTDRCLTFGEGNRIYTITYVAKQHGIKTVMRKVYSSPELKPLADSFGAVMPFIELNGKTLDFFKVGERMIEDRTLEEFINEQ